MGLADALLKLGLTYGESDAVEMCDRIGFTMADTAIAASALLAKEQGAFEACCVEEIMTTPYFLANTSEETRELVKEYGLRNSQLLTIAPTGTLSTMLGISGGIEPVYANYYERKTESLHGADVYYKVYTKIVDDYMKKHGITDESNLPSYFVTAMTLNYHQRIEMQSIWQTHIDASISVDDYMKKHGITDESNLPSYFVTAMTLNYHQRIEMQSIWQTHIDASISSTVNVPNSFSVEETEELYLYAFERGLKGITIFRDGCKRVGILTTKETKKVTAGEGLERGEIILVTDDVVGKKRKLITGCGSLHCIALFDPHSGALLETYLSKGSTGGCNNFMVGLSRMISISARGGIDIETIVDQLNSSGSCPSYTARRVTKKDTSKGACCPMAVGNALMEMYNEMQQELAFRQDCPKALRKPKAEPKAVPAPEADRNMFCPECGEKLVFEEGCNICKNCGWSIKKTKGRAEGCAGSGGG